ncbi:hypothetical protein J1N35_043500 [Gossypium stocksii]|uniref:Uncharacterized protein n=1 Tax=Gossypium stocksii TaxID=47602 RepID=A0A9D3ZF50_9ROSI|nr:hypothetical protein J1N35_043500 [Gossypium stocksii]
MVQTHLDNKSPFLESYIEFSMPDQGSQMSTSVHVRDARTEEYVDSPTTQLCGGFTTMLGTYHYDIPKPSMGRHSSVSTLNFNHDRNSYEGMTSTSSGWLSTNNSERFDNYMKRDDVPPTASTSDGTSNSTHVGGFENEDDSESDAVLIWEPGAYGSEFALFFEPLSIPIELEDSEGCEDPNEDAEEDPRFRAYSPTTHIHNVDLSTEVGLEFVELPHKWSGHMSSSLDLGDLEVGKEFSTEDGFVAVVKR